MPKPATHTLSRKHEDDVHALLGGHNSKSSGNQWHDPADGKLSRYEEEFAFAWDCKCVMPGTKSLSISRDDLTKLTQQAHGNRPMMPLRFYSSERGHIDHDFVAVKLHDFVEMRDRIIELEAALDGLG